jgi:hypothetical protein
MSVERGTEANELNMTYTTRGKQRDCLSCNQGGCLYLYILNLYHHTSYTVYYTPDFTYCTRVGRSKNHTNRISWRNCIKGQRMIDIHTALASNDMNAAVQGQIHRDASPARMDQDKRKRKIGVSQLNECNV